ncbi:hypothetical protein [Roseomonas genomospecies 6]|uniref:Uncharacterized protein n=1 Tax=Roseomonas genomospecies 6 TaxID=214106 RepID=A0A9W7NGI5_9PROT|nr:hypothetical protein [Roseomonas genomospecies 6]KAA0677784.1 hypothetical protein DS843_21940 [Roseomonas genomospecies 6]
MIRLNLPSAPYDIALEHGVTVTVRPCSTAIYEAARSKMSRLVRDIARQREEAAEVGARLEGLPDLTDDDQRAGFSQALFVTALAQAAVTAWSGVLDADGSPAPVNDVTVAELMRIPAIAERFAVEYTRPHADLVAEGNGSTAGQNGTIPAGVNTAAGAPNKTSPVPEANAA